MMNKKRDHTDLEFRLKSVLNEINHHRGRVFNMYTFKDPGVRSTTNFFNSITKLDRLLIAVEKDIRRLLLDKLSIQQGEIDFVFICLDDIRKVLDKTVLGFEKIYFRYYKEDCLFNMPFFINRSTNKVSDELTSDACILGSRMRSCLLLLSKRP